MDINSIMRAEGITPNTELEIMDNALAMFRAWETFTEARTAHFIAHREWLPSYFEKEASRFFGGRYTEEDIHEVWVCAHDHLNPNWEQEADDALANLTDDERAELEEAVDDMMTFVEKKFQERDKTNAVLAELAKDFQ
jgi:hypothetical protein